MLPITFDAPPVDGSQNEKLPIARLPPEILAEVFTLLCETSELSDYSWVVCSHVSSSWRQIALGIPDLWAHVVFTSPRWTRLCIQRSKSSLMIIEVNITSTWVQDLVCEVLGQAGRVGRITLRFLDLSDQLSKLLGGPFPALTSLSIESNSFWVSPNIPVHPGMQPYPRLRNLLVCSNTGWLPPLPVPLVSLELDIENMVFIGWDVFAEALQQLLELQVLRLRDFPVPSASSSTRRILLPSLLHLTLSSSPTNCTQFIQALEYSYVPQYDFHLSTVSDTPSLFETVLPTLAIPPKSMFLHRVHSTQAVFGFVYKDVRNHRVVTADVCFGWTYPLSDSEFAEIFTAISDIPLINGIQWFLLLDWNIIPQGSWSALFQRLVHLQCLVVTGSPSSGLFWDLIKRSEDDLAGEPMLPELTEVELSNVDCSAGGWLACRPGVNGYFDLDGARFLEVLICYLEVRTIKLAKLRLNRCSNYTGAEIKLLRRLVAEVEWDGAGWVPPTYFPNRDEFGAVTINHNLLSRRPGYEEQNLSDEERWRRNNWVHRVPVKN
ncbi:hypothetical protein FB451DRAFT_1391129 [Mycena latifolia]|nr:hypothetical protein FB451DRAFT_1391129 [Mycena latifolia]